MRAFNLYFRYALTGVVVAATYWALTTFLAHVSPAPDWSVSAFAFTVAVCLQYVMHAKYTFRSKAAHVSQSRKFILSVFLGYLISFIVTGFAGPYLGLPIGISAAIVVILLPIMNFLLFSLWVFRK